MTPERRSKVALAIATVGALVAAVAMLVQVDDLDVVGIGTLALAIATFVLALYTRSLVREAGKELAVANRQVAVSQQQAEVANRQVAVSQQQAEVAQKTLDAQVRPLLIPARPDPSRTEEILYADNSTVKVNADSLHV